MRASHIDQGHNSRFPARVLERRGKNIPKSAFLSAEEQVQLLSGSCPRNITKARLEWLSYRKGTSKDGSAKSDATKAELVLRYEQI